MSWARQITPIVFNTINAGTGLFDDGSAANPSIAFSNDNNTGIYRIGADNIGISTGGVLRFDISTSAVTSTVPYYAPVTANAGAPAYSFPTDRDTGMYRITANYLGFSTAGNSAMYITATGKLVTGVIANGPTDPAIAVGNLNTGFYQNAQDLGIAHTGVNLGYFTSTALEMTASAEAAPSFSWSNDTDTGMYRVGADNMGISTGGVLRFDISTLAVTSTLPARLLAGTAASCAYSFTGDPNTGIYQVAADALGISAGGACGSFVPAGYKAINGSAAAPSIAFDSEATTGVYRKNPGLGFAVAGSAAGSVVAAGYKAIDGGAAAPSIAFDSEATTGFYRKNPGIGFAVAGSAAGSIIANGYAPASTGSSYGAGISYYAEHQEYLIPVRGSNLAAASTTVQQDCLISAVRMNNTVRVFVGYWAGTHIAATDWVRFSTSTTPSSPGGIITGVEYALPAEFLPTTIKANMGLNRLTATTGQVINTTVHTDGKLTVNRNQDDGLNGFASGQVIYIAGLMCEYTLLN